MRQLSGKVIRPLLKEVIMQNLSSVPLSFYLYLDQENQDCVSYLNSIKKLLESFSVPYVIGCYDKDKTKEENLSIFKAGISKHSVLLLRPLPIKEEKEFIIGTVVGVIYKLEEERPDAAFYFPKTEPVCVNMDKITLDHVIHVLETGENEVSLPPKEHEEKAKEALHQMLLLAK